MSPPDHPVLRRRAALLLPAALPVLLLFETGRRGIDFGTHWDEWFQAYACLRTVASGVLLPDVYNYPSVTYGLCLAAAGPEIVQAWGSGRTPNQSRDWFLHRYVVANVLLRTRTVFLAIASLGALWVYLAVLAAGRRPIEALVGACALAFSWELAYHSRWVAPDAVLMQFGALTLLLSVKAAAAPRSRLWTRSAAVAAGLAAGTKYQGVLLLLPVLAATLLGPENGSRRLRRSLDGVLFFVLSYLLSTPGTILQPLRFLEDLGYELRHYDRGHRHHDVTAGPAHLGLQVQYLAVAFFSRFPVLAVPLFLLALVGAAAFIRERRSIGAIVLGFPVVYLLLVSLLRVMIVRNLIVLGPFLAFCVARGAATAGRLVLRGFLRAAAVGTLGAALAVNAGWLVSAAASIRGRSADRSVQELGAWLDARPGLQYLVSERVWAALSARPGNASPPRNVTRDTSVKVEGDVFFASEGRQSGRLSSNRPVFGRKLFGPWEVNLDYYPDWAGDDRIVVQGRRGR